VLDITILFDFDRFDSLAVRPQDQAPRVRTRTEFNPPGSKCRLNGTRLGVVLRG
jgi:hypothetical protein